MVERSTGTRRWLLWNAGCGSIDDPRSYAVRVVLLLGSSGTHISADPAAQPVPDIRRQYRIRDDRRYRIYARSGTRESRRRMNIEKRNVNALILLGAIELITAAFG